MTRKTRVNRGLLLCVLLVVFTGIVYGLAIENHGLMLLIFVVGAVTAAVLAQRKK